METKSIVITKGLTTKKVLATGATYGSGACKRLYSGRSPDNKTNFWAYIWPEIASTDPFWDGVGQIVNAYITVYTDDGLGVEGVFTKETYSPEWLIRKLTTDWTPGASASFVTGDYLVPGYSVVGQYTTKPSPAILEGHQIDVTSFIEDFAPSTVRRRDGTPGGKQAYHGIGLFGSATLNPLQAYSIVSGQSEGDLSAYRPQLTLEYELGHTNPGAPTNLAPVGSVASFTAFAGDFYDVKNVDSLNKSSVQVFTQPQSGTAEADTDVITAAAHGLLDSQPVYMLSLTDGTGLNENETYYVMAATANTFKVASSLANALASTPVDITVDYSDVTFAQRLYAGTLQESNTAILAGRFSHTPNGWSPKPDVTYGWRARCIDQDGDTGDWSAVVEFTVTNTAPDAPTLRPLGGAAFDSFNGVWFRGWYTDPDDDPIRAYQVQMASVSNDWANPASLVWSSGKRAAASSPFQTTYSGASLTAGTYYWRARVWDIHDAASAWSAEQSIILNNDFVVDPGLAGGQYVGQRAETPWRIVIRDLGALRGPGDVVAVIEDAYNVGASEMYNSPGEAHWTLKPDHPQASVIEPRKSHYAIEFRQGDGWREVFAGLVMDFDDNGHDIIFYGTDYLGLLDYVSDTQTYDPATPDKDAEFGGSKYTGWEISSVIEDQLTRAVTKTNSPVGFIGIGSIDTMAEIITVYSTYQPALNFCASLIDSHRAGTGKRTRLSVQKTTGGGYEFVVQDDPSVYHDNVPLRYGELVQGYRVIPLGSGWATSVAAVGRDRDGVMVRYQSVVAPGIDEAEWGSWELPLFFDGVNDENDLVRKARQAAVGASRLGRQMGLALRSGYLLPRDGYNITDYFPVTIKDGPIDTSTWLSQPYWCVAGITWQALQRGDLNTILTLQPIEYGEVLGDDLLGTLPISPQAEWQIGWEPPDPLTATSRYYLDQSTGIVYVRNPDGTYSPLHHDPRNNNMLFNSGFELFTAAGYTTVIWPTNEAWNTASDTENLRTADAALNMTTSTY